MRFIARLFSKIIKTLGIISLLLILLVFFTTIGYKIVNQETKVATIHIIPNKTQEFTAVVNWVDGTREEFAVTGDQFYIDAKILKWNSWVSFLGVKTWYEFDRLGGRYISVEDEQNKPRSIYQLSEKKDFDLYLLRKQYTFLDFMVDAEYGSAAFFMADVKKNIDLYVARSGLTAKINYADQKPELKVN